MQHITPFKAIWQVILHRMQDNLPDLSLSGLIFFDILQSMQDISGYWAALRLLCSVCGRRIFN
ncbi:hypothetical protein Pjdr2_0391 [Paenibacillus sp. JDR-2]|nr:hypothetical protein Pjdr2_0391 [Paenibacillus sp. JDR-2]